MGGGGEYRAYETLTDWSGPVRATESEAESDVEERNRVIRARGGITSAVIARRRNDRLASLDGEPIWPPYGRTHGAARWR